MVGGMDRMTQTALAVGNGRVGIFEIRVVGNGLVALTAKPVRFIPRQKIFCGKMSLMAIVALTNFYRNMDTQLSQPVIRILMTFGA